MVERKICLMVTQDVIKVQACMQNNCAWWIPKDNACAAASLTQNLAYVEK
jgi:hypothetical protein